MDASLQLRATHLCSSCTRSSLSPKHPRGGSSALDRAQSHSPHSSGQPGMHPLMSEHASSHRSPRDASGNFVKPMSHDAPLSAAQAQPRPRSEASACARTVSPASPRRGPSRKGALPGPTRPRHARVDITRLEGAATWAPWRMKSDGWTDRALESPPDRRKMHLHGRMYTRGCGGGRRGTRDLRVDLNKRQLR